MKYLVLLALCGLALGLPTGRLDEQGAETFLNHRLVDVNITSVAQQNYINNLANVGDMGLDIWLYPTLVNTGRLRVPPESIDLFMELMQKSGVSAKIRVHNLKQLNDAVYAMPAEPVNYADFIQGVMWHNNYYRLSDIDQFTTNFASFSGVSKSYLSRLTYMEKKTPFVEITGGYSSNKKSIFIEAGMHAREWISPASAMYFIDRLLHRRESDADANYLYNYFNWYIVPVSNPDGYEYSHTNNRYWRKNRNQVSTCGSSRGVDLNRNFDSMWGGSGSSGICSSDLYRGPAVFSEIESQNIRDKVQEIKRRGETIHAYLSIHAFSQLLLTPYGFQNNTYPPNYDYILDITNKARAAILNSDGKTYRVGTPAEILYSADGGSHDWARLTENIQYAMTYELRPDSGGLGGFVLPPGEIAPCSKEVWDSLYAIASNL
ncbi:carboxypeptidase B-like [Haliotis asinina]|uniref:carboxypeptidase B-like n=1 Tax=Haliotis asinina TaxID=109174 RepID=UPI0035325CE8